MATSATPHKASSACSAYRSVLQEKNASPHRVRPNEDIEEATDSQDAPTSSIASTWWGSGGSRTVGIRDDAGGHNFGEGNAQNLVKVTPRIEGHISTTQPVTTMTIKREIRTASDLSKDNDILVLRNESLSCALSAVAMISSFEPIPSSQAAALNFIDATVKEKLPDFEAWLLVGHATWQPDTKIARYKKLSSYLDYGRLCAAEAKQIGECIVESDRGIKFFDALQCSRFNIDEIVALQRDARACVLIYTKNNEALNLVERFLKTGWDRDNHFIPSILLNAVCSSNLLICCPLGEFDDSESGYAIVGRPEIIANLCIKN